MSEIPKRVPEQHEDKKTDETLDEEFEPTLEDVLKKTRQLVDQNTDKATFGTYMEYGSKEIRMLSKDGRLIIIEEVLPGRAKEGYVLQDIGIYIERGDSGVGTGDVDYNYNQYGDGLMRKRVFNHVEGMETAAASNTGDDEDLDSLIERTYALIHEVEESTANRELEEQFGINNQPVNDGDLAEVWSLLETSIVLDPLSR